MTHHDRKRRLWEWFFGGGARREVSVYGANAPTGAYTLYNDGGGITLAMPFSVNLEDPICVGGKVWMPSIEPNHTPQVQIMLWNGLDISQDPVRSVVVDTVLGWTEARWEPFLISGNFAIGYQFVGTGFSTNYYVHSPNARVSGAPVVAEGGGLQINATPALFRVGSGGTSQSNDVTSYGVDAIVEG